MKMKRKVMEVGSSLAITIPKDVVESYDVYKGMIVEIEPKDETIEIKLSK